MRELLKNIIKYVAIIFSIIVVIIISITPIKSYSQNGFEKTFGGSEWEMGMDVKQLSDSNIIICGYSMSYGNGSADGYLIKTDPSGNEIWSTIITTDFDLNLWGIVEFNNYFYSCGSINTDGSSNTKIFFTKVNNNGDTIFTKIYSIGTSSYCTDLVSSNDGNFVLCGQSDNKVCYLKVDSNGNFSWSKIINTSTSSHSTSITHGINGGYAICGTIYSNVTDVFLLKINDNGDSLWSNSYGGTMSDNGQDIITTSDNSYIICGEYGDPGYSNQFYILKIDQSGDTIWTKKYGGIYAEQCRSILQTVDGGYIVTGYSISYSQNDDYDIYILKINSLGDYIWSKTYGDILGDVALGSDYTFDNAAIICGKKGISTINNDLYLIKVVDDSLSGFSPTSSSIVGLENSSFEWFDYDNDGDLDFIIAGWDGTSYHTEVYQNQGNDVFVNINAGLIGTHYGDISVGDYDNDNDIDILISGGIGPGPITKLYRNDNGAFTAINTGIIDVIGGNHDFGDYDNDGDLDIALTGQDENQNHQSKIYRNIGGGLFTDVNAGLLGLSSGTIMWGDYDNDGDLDILLTGSNDSGSTQYTKIYANNDGTFSDISANLINVSHGESSWGDYDEDGDLDIIISGLYQLTNNYCLSKIYRNDGSGNFIDISANIQNLHWSSVDWGDSDNDGDLDLLMSGCDSLQNHI